MRTRNPKSFKALILTAVIAILGGLGYLRYHHPHQRTPMPGITAPGPRAASFTGRVVSVIDGDTITVLDAENRQLKVRLDGIDAPEHGQAFGTRSKQSLSELVSGRDVTVTATKTDRYGRTVGMVTVDGRDAELEQLKRGNAWFYRHYAGELDADRARAYEQAEQQARADHRGLWRDRDPVEPWEFRQERRTAR